MTDDNPETDVRIRFRNRLYPAALKIEETTGIKKEFLIAQAAHESGWGQSDLARRDNNLFGMTATEDWLAAGHPITTMPTREYSKYPPEKIRYWTRPGDVIEKMKDGKGGSVLKVMRDFRKYTNWDESMEDWADRISNLPLYKLAYSYAKEGDAEKFISAVAEAGYGSDPRYATKLTGVYHAVTQLPPFTAVA